MSIYRSNTQAPANMPSVDAVPKKYTISASTHEGKVRSFNEDNFSVNTVIGLEQGNRRTLRGKGMKEPLVCGVFDGTGGEVAGVAASRLAAEYATWLYKSYAEKPSDRERHVNRYISECNSYIVEKLYSYDGRRGATTVIAAIINNGKLYSYSLGDSRLYLYTGGKMYLVSNDHTIAMERYREGVYSRDQAEHSSDRHKLTAFLGIEPASSARAEKYEPINLAKGDRLLLCSDGLYSMLTDSETSEILASDSEDKARDLTELAILHGGKDNITCMVIECEE